MDSRARRQTLSSPDIDERAAPRSAQVPLRWKGDGCGRSRKKWFQRTDARVWKVSGRKRLSHKDVGDRTRNPNRTLFRHFQCHPPRCVLALCI